MRVVFMGTPDFAVVDLERLVDAGHEILAVFCQPDKPKGRSHTPAPPPVKVCATCHHLEINQPRKLGKKTREALETLKPDIIIVSAYGKLLPPSILNLPKYGCINVHASLLPKYRGAAPIQWAIANGEAETGITLMQLDEGLDTGDILDQVLVPIEEDDTAESLHDRLAEEGATLLVNSLPRIQQGALLPTPQDAQRATLAPLLHRDHGLLDWTWPALDIHNRIRGFHPWPGTYSFFNQKVLKVFPHTSVLNDQSDSKPGTILNISKEGIVISCGQGTLVVEMVQLAGKRRMNACDFANGARIETGATLGTIPTV